MPAPDTVPAPRSPMAGLRVVDLSTVVFGPYCTQTLADLGADVIKIEPPEGDSVRVIGKPAHTVGMGPVFLRLNRGKRSVVWDMKSPTGRTALQRLLATADIVVLNFRPEAVARLGLDYEAVRALRPDVIYVHCTGFGLDGPYAGLQAYDDVIQASTGASTLLPRVDGNPAPRYLPMLFADKVSGLHATYAVLAALVHRLRTGEGQQVEVPMFESLSSFNLVEHFCDQTLVPPTGGWGYARQLDPVRQPMRSSDGWLSVAPYLDDRWQRFFQAVDRPDMFQRPSLATKDLRRQNMAEMYTEMAAILPSRTSAQWLALFKQIAVPAMAVKTIGDLPDDPHLQKVGMFRERQHPTEGAYLEVRQPVRFGGCTLPDVRHAPQLGEHSDELLRELGLLPN
ncbi:MAG: carnitine dehydratase [Burkholderiales bacterium PBB5]|nr:MAG: carnitine dehydratase [Burkholderiales bacterium PBB5]